MEESACASKALGWTSTVKKAWADSATKKKNDVNLETKRTATVRCQVHRLFLISMTALGVVHPLRMSNVPSALRVLATMYSAVITLMLTFDTVRVGYTLFQDCDNQDIGVLSDKISAIASEGIDALSCGILFTYFCLKDNGAVAYYKQLRAARHILQSAGNLAKERHARVFEVFLFTLSWLIFLVYAAYTVTPLLMTETSGYFKDLFQIAAPNATTGMQYTIVQYFYAIMCFYGSAAYVFSITYAVLVSGQLSKLFVDFKKILDEHIIREPRKVLESLGKYRRIYGEITEAVDRASVCLVYLIGSHLTTNLAFSMLQLYVYICSKENSDLSMPQDTVAIWLSTTFAAIAAEVVAGCWLTEKAKKCRESIRKLSHEDCESSGSAAVIQFQLFLEQTNEEVHFTICGLFPISKETILPILGTWFTYFLIIIQSGTTQSVPSTSAIFNSTS